MRKILIFFFGLFLVVASCAGVSAGWVEQWHFDVASFDYSEFQSHYSEWGRIHYRSEGQPLAADTISNGYGSAGKPILEVYLAGGMAHGEAAAAGIDHVPGSVYCLNGATGDVIWHVQDEECVFVHTMMELADCTGDGHLDLLVADYKGMMVLNARTGDVIWKRSWSYPGNTPGIVNHRLDKHNSIIRDPSDGVVYVYTSTDTGRIYKRVGSTGVMVAQSIVTNRPCYGGQAAADVTGDGDILIIEGSGIPDEGTGYGILAFDLDLNLVWKMNNFRSTGGVPVLVDVNYDGYLDVVVNTAGSSARIGVIDGRLSWQNRFQAGGDGLAVWMSGKSPTSTGCSSHNAPAVASLSNDGTLYAVMSCSSYGPGGVWDISDWHKETSWPALASGQTPGIGNVWGDVNLEIIDTPYYRIYSRLGSLLYSLTSRIGSTPLLVADVDGDGVNEVLSDGSNIFSVPGSPWGGPVWSWGWYICWETGASAVNTRQEVLSQLYNSRRTGAEFPLYPYLWEGGSSSPPQPVIAVVSPNGGEVWEIGETYEIMWVSENISGDVSVELYRDGVFVDFIEAVTSNDGSLLWTVDLSVKPGVGYTIRVSSGDGVFSDLSDDVFTLVAPSEPLIVTGPSWGLIHNNYGFSINATDPHGDSIYCMWDWGDGNVSEWFGPYEYGETVYTSYSWHQPGVFAVKVKVKNVSGLESNWSEPHRMEITLPIACLFGVVRNIQQTNEFTYVNAVAVVLLSSSSPYVAFYQSDEVIAIKKGYATGVLLENISLFGESIDFVIGRFNTAAISESPSSVNNFIRDHLLSLLHWNPKNK